MEFDFHDVSDPCAVFVFTLRVSVCCSKYIIPNIFTGSSILCKKKKKTHTPDLHCIGAGVVYLQRQEANGGEEVNRCLLVPVTDETVTEID